MLVRIMNPCVERCRQFGSKLHMTIVTLLPLLIVGLRTTRVVMIMLPALAASEGRDEGDDDD